MAGRVPTFEKIPKHLLERWPNAWSDFPFPSGLGKDFTEEGSDWSESEIESDYGYDEMAGEQDWDWGMPDDYLTEEDDDPDYGDVVGSSSNYY